MTYCAESGYRPDLDGLRAFAVIAVIIHHYLEGWLPAGFLGVDVFFVLSGFVITGSLYRSRSKTLIGFLLGFYSRRVKRLVPALVACVLTTALAISLFDASPAHSLTTGLASLFGLSNMYLLGEAVDYFGGPAQLNVYTHTWSLGVEEQFYVLFPLLVWLLDLGTRRAGDSGGLIRVVALVTALSLLLYLGFGGPGNPVSFFLMPTRFWEIGMGVLTWLFAVRLAGSIPKFNQASSFTLLILLIALMFAPAEYAGGATVAIVILTVTLILAGTRAPPNRMLVHPVSVHTGRASYSLYLWHWPVLVLSRLTIGVEGWALACAAAITTALAFASYHWIEAPLRHMTWAKSPGRTLVVGGGAMFVAAALVFALAVPLKGTLYTGRVPELIASGVESLSDSYVIEGTSFRWAGSPCVIASSQEVGKRIQLDACTLGDIDTAHGRILVLGDSFSVAFVQAFDSLVVDEGRAVTFVAAWGASPVPQIDSSPVRAAANADYWSRVVPELLAGLRSGDHVLLINDLSSFSPASKSEDATLQLKLLEQGLVELADSLARRRVGLSILYGISLAREANCAPAAAVSQWFRVGSSCNFLSRTETLRRRGPLHQLIQDLQKRRGLVPIDVIDVFCPGDTCTYEHPNGTMLYRDSYSHPSVEAARLLANPIRQVLMGTEPVP